MTHFDQRGIGKLRVLLVLLVLAALVAGYFWGAMKWSYSSGERAGWVQKLSRKGWVCKTWEGEMAMVTMPGAIPEKFYFTVRDDGVAERINQVMGKRVTLHYDEKVGLPTSCFGDTRHFVNRVTVVDEAPAAPGGPGPGPAAPVPPPGAAAPKGCSGSSAYPPVPPSRAGARSAPCRRLASFAHTTLSATMSDPAKVPKPQSTEAITRRRSPTASTTRQMRSATTSGCSTKLVVESMTPGSSSRPSGRGWRWKTRYSWPCRGLASSMESPPTRAR